ncbi:MAG: ornithine cyclodeaminase family protein [Pseudomonadota bacterium]|nr:ornithine cyclodeaminase family protein [Pseudomonadota bacterium]
MIVVGEEETRERLEFGALVEAIRDAFKGGIESPAKHQHYVEVPGEPEGKIMMMPAWRSGDYVCVKLVNMFPGNADRGMPAVSGIVILFDGRTGEVLAQVDGGEVTARRTAAASALAADYLARKDSATHLVVGTGRVAWNLIFAHCAVRSLEKTFIWGRNYDKARAMAADATKLGANVEAVEDVEAATRGSDIISCATFSADPIVFGDWLQEGAHLDLVGSYRPELRETDDTSIRRATVFCDTLGGAPKAAGDLTQPIASGVLKFKELHDLYALVGGSHPGRTSDDEITMFKSVGASLEDFAAAVLIYEQVAKEKC